MGARDKWSVIRAFLSSCLRRHLCIIHIISRCIIATVIQCGDISKLQLALVCKPSLHLFLCAVINRWNILLGLTKVHPLIHHHIHRLRKFILVRFLSATTLSFRLVFFAFRCQCMVSRLTFRDWLI